jgi:response regulator RpfG family c-di-GMP phosphodiesterase
MRPTDTARTSAWSTRPPEAYTAGAICQESANGGYGLAGTVLLLNFDPIHREVLTRNLEASRYKVIAPEAEGTALHAVRDEVCEVDYVIFDVTRTDDQSWNQLRRVCRVRRHDGWPVMIACSSRRDDPKLQLAVEELGARFIYAPE